MAISRILEPEVMDSKEEALDYNTMDHSQVNRCFVDDFLNAASREEFHAKLHRSFENRERAVKLLDAGTGTALIPIELCGRNTNCHITAIDLAGEMLKVARQNVIREKFENRIALELVDSKCIPYEDRSFDAVISNSILHHIPEPSSVLKELVRICKQGGLLFVRDLMRPESEEKLTSLVVDYAGDANDHQQRMFAESLHAALTLDEVQSLLLNLGLPADCVRANSDRHWTISLTLE